MQNLRTIRKFGLLFLILLTGACGGTPANEVENIPVIQADPEQTPADVVAGFLEGWNARDYEAMYSYVSVQSQEQYPFSIFQLRYEVTGNDLNLSGLTYSVGETHLQGVAASVNYNVTLESPLFGTIDDPGRTIRLVKDAEGWRIAWSSMDIFEAMAGSSELRVDSRHNIRGNIYDRNGEILAEEGGTVVVLYAAQEDMFDVNSCINFLARMLRRHRADIVSLFSNYLPETIFYVGETDLDIYLDNRVELEQTCGIFDDETDFSKVRQRQTRRYFANGAAVHITGYVGPVTAEQEDHWRRLGFQPGDVVGQSGIELQYQSTLAGNPERYLTIAEPGGTTLRELGGAIGSPSASVTLTIDSDMQLMVAQSLWDAYNYARDNWGAVSLGAAAVVMDVNTGEVLALASYPSFYPGVFNIDTFDPNVVDERVSLTTDPRTPLVNKAVQNRYSPGSVFKIITTIATAQEGIFGLDEIFDCTLEWYGEAYGDTLPRRLDWRATDGYDATGEITLSQALTSSCDPFFYQMGAILYRNRGPNKLVEYAEMLGLGGFSGIEILEVPSELAPPASVAEAINNAIGQGSVEITPLQMAVAVSAVANGGTVYRPYIVQSVGNPDGSPATQTTPTIVRDLSYNEGVLEAVRRGMCDVTTDENLGTAYLIFGENPTPYSVCGKTGTAQTALYPNAWFVAYAPADDPEIAVVVMSANSREGSEVAAPIVRRILDNYFDVAWEDFPEWWEDPYVPLDVPEGGVSGG